MLTTSTSVTQVYWNTVRTNVFFGNLRTHLCTWSKKDYMYRPHGSLLDCKKVYIWHIALYLMAMYQMCQLAVSTASYQTHSFLWCGPSQFPPRLVSTVCELGLTLCNQALKSSACILTPRAPLHCRKRHLKKRKKSQDAVPEE